MARRLFLIRHGQTTYNATGRMQGHLDTQLSDEGRALAQAVGQMLVDKDIRKIVSSDLTRAADTAAAVGKRLGLDYSVDVRLRETDLGTWQGMNHEEVDEQFPGQRAIWRHDPTWAPPEGESRVEVAQRARPVIDELMQSFPQWEDGAVLIVAHGGAIAALTSILLDLEISQYGILSGLKNTHWAQLTARPAFDANTPVASLNFNESNPEEIAAAQWYLDGWNMGAKVSGGAGADV